MTLILNLENLMKIHGMSVSELARQTQIPQPTLHHILTGTTKKPRKDALEALANYFSLSVAQLTGALPLPSVIPNSIKDNLKISIIPLVDWGLIKTWPSLQDKVNAEFKKIILDREINEFSFALTMPDSSMEPVCPEKSILIFEYDKKPKDREFVLIYSSQTGKVIFNRLFIDGFHYYVKQSSTEDNIQLVKLNLSVDKIIGTLIEVRMQF